MSEISTVTLFEWVDGDWCYQIWSSKDMKMDDSKRITQSSDVRIVLRLYHISYVYIINIYTYYMYAYYIAVRREECVFLETMDVVGQATGSFLLPN